MSGKFWNLPSPEVEQAELQFQEGFELEIKICCTTGGALRSGGILRQADTALSTAHPGPGFKILSTQCSGELLVKDQSRHMALNLFSGREDSWGLFKEARRTQGRDC